jgi:hypothetical protein
MCVPALAAPLAIAAGAVQAGGAIYSGLAARSQANHDAAVARINAQQEIDAAHDSVTQGQSEAQSFWRKVAQTKGQQIASMAANGIDLGYGSAARLQEDTQMLANEDATNLYHNIEQRTKGHYINASNYVEQAKAAKSAGKAAFTSSLFSAAGSLMGGFSQAAGMSAKLGTSTGG